MKSIVKKWWFFPLLLALFWGGLKIYKTPDQKQGVPAQNFVGYLPDGDSIELADYKGQLVLLDFWGSWCGPCRQHNKSLVKLYKKYRGTEFREAEKFSIISVAAETNKSRWLRAIEQDGLAWFAHIFPTSTASKTTLQSCMACAKSPLLFWLMKREWSWQWTQMKQRLITGWQNGK